MKKSKMTTILKELKHYLETYVGRPSPLFFAERITNDLGGPKKFILKEMN